MLVRFLVVVVFRVRLRVVGWFWVIVVCLMSRNLSLVCW